MELIAADINEIRQAFAVDDATYSYVTTTFDTNQDGLIDTYEVSTITDPSFSAWKSSSWLDIFKVIDRDPDDHAWQPFNPFPFTLGSDYFTDTQKQNIQNLQNDMISFFNFHKNLYDAEAVKVETEKLPTAAEPLITQGMLNCMDAKRQVAAEDLVMPLESSWREIHMELRLNESAKALAGVRSKVEANGSMTLEEFDTRIEDLRDLVRVGMLNRDLRKIVKETDPAIISERASAIGLPADSSLELIEDFELLVDEPKVRDILSAQNYLDIDLCAISF